MEDSPFDFNTPITEDTTLTAMYDCPNGVTLTQLKAALDNGTAATVYPTNTQVDDYTNGTYDPWIVGHYGKQYGDNNTDGVYLYRKYLYPENQAWGAGNNYGESTINTWLNTTYFESCSDEIKGMAEQINLPLVSGTTSAKMFLMSAAEVMAFSTSYAGGVQWESWKERTGLTEPSTGANPGRIMSYGELANGQGETWLLRTEMNDASGNASIEGDGACKAISPSTPGGVVVACFIAKASLYDPSNPTLEGIKAAIDAGDYAAFPVGTEIPDEWNGNSNPLIVAQYLDSTNNSSYGGAEGVILLRKYIEPTSVAFGSSSDYRDRSINIHAVLKDYYNKSSDALKAIMSTINVPYYTGSSIVPVPSDWFLMSGIEVCGTPNTGEGEQWTYWKNVTGLSSASNGNNAGRVKQDRNGTNTRWWLRSWYSFAAAWRVDAGGDLNSNYYSSYSFGVLPACFVAKGSN